MQLKSPTERQRKCETCSETFTPRMTQLRMGQGRFCSQKCNTAFRDGYTAEAKARSAATRAKMRAEGKIKYRYGPDNPTWKGGTEAWKARRKLKQAAEVASGEAARKLREYRKANPDKVREFSNRRAGRKLDRLPYGTLPKLRAAQGDRCALCKTKLDNGDHIDHILPLAKGGKHEPGNLQILCPPCNLKKSDRDPFIHAQSLGLLL